MFASAVDAAIDEALAMFPLPPTSTPVFLGDDPVTPVPPTLPEPQPEMSEMLQAETAAL